MTEMTGSRTHLMGEDKAAPPPTGEKPYVGCWGCARDPDK